MPRTIAISQSNYIPWKGYFDMIDSVDEFLLLDEVQFTRRDWRNRNKVKTANGVSWLSIPVVSKGRYEQRIDETLVADAKWARSHWDTLRQAYGRAPGFDHYGARWQAAYTELADVERLSDVNRGLIELACSELGITTPIKWSTDYAGTGRSTELLLSLCLAAEADVYLSGPAAQAYLDVERFEASGIAVRWMDYSGYPVYEQPHGEFEHGVSVVDLLFSAGPQAAELFRGRRGHLA